MPVENYVEVLLEPDQLFASSGDDKESLSMSICILKQEAHRC